MTAASLTARLLRDILCRVIFALESTDPGEREAVLADLEHDLVTEIQRPEQEDGSHAGGEPA